MDSVSSPRSRLWPGLPTLLRAYCLKSWIVVSPQFCEASIITPVRKLRVRTLSYLSVNRWQAKIKVRFDPKSQRAVTPTPVNRGHEAGSATICG